MYDFQPDSAVTDKKMHIIKGFSGWDLRSVVLEHVMWHALRGPISHHCDQRQPITGCSGMKYFSNLRVRLLQQCLSNNLQYYTGNCKMKHANEQNIYILKNISLHPFSILFILRRAYPRELGGRGQPRSGANPSQGE